MKMTTYKCQKISKQRLATELEKKGTCYGKFFNLFEPPITFIFDEENSTSRDIQKAFAFTVHHVKNGLNQDKHWLVKE